MPSTASVTSTTDPSINGVLMGVKWGTTTLTYSFPTDPGQYGTYTSTNEPANNFEAFNAAQQNAARATLKMVSSYTNLNFTEVVETATVHGDLRYAESDSTGTAWGYYPSSSQVGGDMWFNNSKNWYDAPVAGNYAFQTIMHETGHALGLKHPHESMGGFAAMPTQHDSLEYTVMSYRSFVGASTTSGYTNASDSYPTTLMMYDIAALQHMYGADYGTNAGNTIYKWNPSSGQYTVDGISSQATAGNKIFMTLWDGGGVDTYDLSLYTTSLDIDLNPGGWSTFSATQLASLGYGNYAAGNVANALLHQGNTASLIENVIGGSAGDVILGNVAANMFTGGAGNDLLDGGAGIDIANYLGAKLDYSWIKNADGSWKVTDLRGIDGIDTLWRIETLKFADGTVSLDGSTLVPTNAAPIITSAAPSVRLAEWADKSPDETANTPHVASGVITYTDADALDLHTARIQAKGSGYLGSLTLDTSAIDSGDRVGWRFAVDDRTIDYLKAGQTLTQAYDVTIDDGRGGTATQTITIALVGADDAGGSKPSAKGKGKGSEVAHLPPGQMGKTDMSDEQAPAPAFGNLAGPVDGLDIAMRPQPYGYDYFLA